MMTQMSVKGQQPGLNREAALQLLNISLQNAITQTSLLQLLPFMSVYLSTL